MRMIHKQLIAIAGRRGFMPDAIDAGPRAFGMVLTVLPTIFAYFWLVSRALAS
jgi:hypothetical protein